jgi:hypothetical protein
MFHAVGDHAVVSVGSSIRLGNFPEPPPEVILLAFRSDMYRHMHADSSDGILFIEAADSSL